MRTILSKVEGMLGRARLWYWLASILATLATSSLFGWLAQRVAIIAAYGYAAVILTGVVFACLVMLAISAGAVAWSRIFASPLDACKSDAAKIEVTKPYLSDPIVVSGEDGTVPSFRARFARNGRDAAFYIEYSVFFRQWTIPITVLIQTVGRFTQGETISIPLMRAVETREGPRWQFGEEMKNGFPVHMIGGGYIYRGRVKFSSQDDVAQ
jgi:hypothetical protein